MSSKIRYEHSNKSIYIKISFAFFDETLCEVINNRQMCIQ